MKKVLALSSESKLVVIHTRDSCTERVICRTDAISKTQGLFHPRAQRHATTFRTASVHVRQDREREKRNREERKRNTAPERTKKRSSSRMSNKGEKGEGVVIIHTISINHKTLRDDPLFVFSTLPFSFLAFYHHAKRRETA